MCVWDPCFHSFIWILPFEWLSVYLLIFFIFFYCMRSQTTTLPGVTNNRLRAGIVNRPMARRVNHLGMETQCRWLAGVQIERQNGAGSGSKWLWTWWTCSLVPDGLLICWSTTKIGAVVWRKIPSWCHELEVRMVTLVGDHREATGSQRTN